MTIVPKFAHDQMYFISGTFGPFLPQTPVEVPLWLAISLKKRRKCSIQPPAWMEKDALAGKLAFEKEHDPFDELPYHFAEVASLLFSAAADDVPEAEAVRTLLEDLSDVRQAKIRRGVQTVAADVRQGGSAYAVKLNNVGAMETSLVRPFLTEALNSFFAFRGQDAEEAARAGGVGTSSQDADAGGGGAAEVVGGRKLRRFR